MPLFGLLFCYLAGFDVTFGTETICDVWLLSGVRIPSRR